MRTEVHIQHLIHKALEALSKCEPEYYLGGGKEEERLCFPPDEGHVLVIERRSSMFHNIPPGESQLSETRARAGTALRTICEAVSALGLASPSGQQLTSAPALISIPRGLPQPRPQRS